jgi:hypothetical protein
MTSAPRTGLLYSDGLKLKFRLNPTTEGGALLKQLFAQIARGELWTFLPGIVNLYAPKYFVFRSSEGESKGFVRLFTVVGFFVSVLK